MRLKIVVVDLEVPPRVKKWCLRIGIPLGALLGGGAVAWAAGLHTWSDGDTLSAADLNGNFGALDTRIAALEKQSHPPSAFRAQLTKATTLQNGTEVPIVFDTTLYDVGGEYDATTGTFTAKQAGTYLVECGLRFVPTGSGGVFAANIHKNAGAEITGFDQSNVAPTGNGLNVASSGVVQLASGDAVVCQGYQSTGSAQPLDLASPAERVFFSATRLY